MKTHYSIDLETLGTRYDSYILSIGVAAFNIETGLIIDTFHTKTMCNDSFNIDLPTVIWWLNQEEGARQAITRRSKVRPIETALNELSTFIPSRKDSIVWGNGASFDITLLDHAYSIFSLKQPWEYYNVRDMRTILMMARLKGFDDKAVKFEGIKHDALHDASHQAKIISMAYNEILGGLK